VPWYADFRDLGALHEGEIQKRNLFAKWIDRLIEKNLLNSASGIFTVSIGLKNVLKLYKKPTAVIYNGWKSNKLNKPSIKNKLFLYFHYAGTVYPHRKKSLNLLIKNLKEINAKLFLRIFNITNVFDNSEILDLKNNKKIVLLPITSQKALLKEQKNACANVVLEDLDKNSYSNKGVLTGKFLRLLTLGPPVLAIARKDSEIRKVIKQTQIGYFSSSPKSISRCIKKIVLRKKQVANLNKLKLFSVQNQAKMIIQIIFNQK